MEVKQLSRVVSSTGKIHQNQEVWSLRGGYVLSKPLIIKMLRKCW